MPIAEPTATYGRGWGSVNSPAAEEGVCNGYVTAVSVALSGGARTVSINKIWKNLGTFLFATVSLSPGLTVFRGEFSASGYGVTYSRGCFQPSVFLHYDICM